MEGVAVHPNVAPTPDRRGGSQGIEGVPVIGPTGVVKVVMAIKPANFRKGGRGSGGLGARADTTHVRS